LLKAGRRASGEPSAADLDGLASFDLLHDAVARQIGDINGLPPYDL
jgi:hypothetical protein